MTMVMINEEVIYLNGNTIEFHSKSRDLDPVYMEWETPV